MFTVSEAEATAIRAAYESGGDEAAVAEFRRLFPNIAMDDPADIRQWVRTIAAWRHLPDQPISARRHQAATRLRRPPEEH